MRLISKELLIPYETDIRPNGSGRAVVTGFAGYASSKEPILMHCSGWEDYSDAYDDFSISVSCDNGRSWSLPEPFMSGYDVPEGKIRYCEPSAMFDRDTEKLIVIADKTLFPNDKLDVDQHGKLVIREYDQKKGRWGSFEDLPLPPGSCVQMISFAFPIKTSSGKILFPAMRAVLNEEGKPLHYKDCWSPVEEPLTVIGEYEADGSLSWMLGAPMAIDPEVNSRGISETTIAELSDGRIASIGRGDNSMFPEKPGYKWLSFSPDDGMSWDDPVPLCSTDGVPVASGSNGSALFRSIKNDKLYWIGNLCIYGERAMANSPRTSLSIVEVQEEPFALKMDTLYVIDEKNYNDSPDLQLSNFRFYQDRKNGEVVLFLVRLCERGGREWWRSDYFCYRIDL